MKKGKIIWKIGSKVLLFFVFFLLLILWRSADWFLNNFDNVDLSVAIYQLFSPLRGTEAGILKSYFIKCLFPSIFLAIVVVTVYTLSDSMAGKIFSQIDRRFGTKRSRIGEKRSMYTNRIKVVILWACIVVLCVCVWKKAVEVGVPEYLESVSNASTIFESEYISPDDVAITFPEKKRNLILIYMESMEATYASTQEGGGKPVNYIPELTQLAEENLFFSDDEDMGGAESVKGTGWTMGGLFASSTGVPYKLPVDGNDAGEYESFAPGLKGLGEIFLENGYQNYFMCGSDVAFGGRRAFYEQHGDYHITDYYSAQKEGIIPEGYREYWGMEDEILYEYAKQQLTEIASQNEPFNFTMLTADTHPSDGYVCNLCGDDYENQYENVLACASRQAVQFVDWISQQSWYENTTIVITGDHKNMKADFWDDIGDYDRKIYNCFINLPNGLSAMQTTNRDFSVLDLFPTTLAAIGADIEGERLALGTNLFSDEKTLPEEMGFEAFNEELSLYSDFYYKNFIIGK